MPHPDLERGWDILSQTQPDEALAPPHSLRRKDAFLRQLLRETKRGVLARMVYQEIPEARAITERLAWHISDQIMAPHLPYPLIHLCITEAFNWLSVNLEGRHCETREDAMNAYLVGLFRALPGLCETEVYAGDDVWDAVYDLPLCQWLIDAKGARKRPADPNGAAMSRNPQDVRAGILYRVAEPREIAMLRHVNAIIGTEA